MNLYDKYSTDKNDEDEEIPPNSIPYEQVQKEQNYPISEKSSHAPSGVKI